MKETSPIFIRIFKENSELEVWKQRVDGKYALLKTYSICKWSGALGPKKVEGDRQAPEGFYIVTPAQMNPNSNYYLSFNIGYPNAYDRALGRTGSQPDGARRLLVGGLLLDDRRRCRRDLRARPRRLPRRPAPVPDPGLPVPHDGGEPGQASRRSEHAVLADAEGRLRPFRGDPHACRRSTSATRSTSSTPTPGNAEFRASAACPAYSIAPEIVAAVAAKQAADDKKFTARAWQSSRPLPPRRPRPSRPLPSARRIPSLLKRMMGVKPRGGRRSDSGCGDPADAAHCPGRRRGDGDRANGVARRGPAAATEARQAARGIAAPADPCRRQESAAEGDAGFSRSMRASPAGGRRQAGKGEICRRQARDRRRQGGAGLAAQGADATAVDSAPSGDVAAAASATTARRSARS